MESDLFFIKTGLCILLRDRANSEASRYVLTFLIWLYFFKMVVSLIGIYNK